MYKFYYKLILVNTKISYIISYIFHNENGPAIEFLGGEKYWYINGKRHRKDGPAIENNDAYKAWYINGDRHRENGPAVEYYNGYKAWFINDKYIKVKTQEEFEQYLRLKAFI